MKEQHEIIFLLDKTFKVGCGIAPPHIALIAHMKRTRRGNISFIFRAGITLLTFVILFIIVKLGLFL